MVVGNGGNAQMTISDGATVSVLGNGQRNFTVTNTATGSGVLTMTNGATIVASRFAVGDNGGSGTATIDNSTVNLDGVIFNNGLDQGPNGAGVRIARGVGANGLLTMQNGAAININNTIDNANVILGGTSVLAGRNRHAEHVGRLVDQFHRLRSGRIAVRGRRRRHGLHGDDRRQHCQHRCHRQRERRKHRRKQRHIDGRRRIFDHGQRHPGSAATTTSIPVAPAAPSSQAQAAP